MSLIISKIEGLVKEAFNSSATDYWKQLEAAKDELAQLKKAKNLFQLSLMTLKMKNQTKNASRQPIIYQR